MTHEFQTLLTDSLLLFESVVNSGWFKYLRTSIILFLTGLDSFNAKLDKVYHKLQITHV
jgi:hypothetical protein